jgi:hypothetical protein
MQDSQGYLAQCAGYNRPDNPLFIPESGPGGSNAWLMFRALGEYGAIGLACFGVEQVLASDGSISPEAQKLAGSYQAAAAAIPLLLQYQGTEKIYAVAQEEGEGSRVLHLDGYTGMVQFGGGHVDWRHGRQAPPAGGRRGRGLIFQVSRKRDPNLGAISRIVLVIINFHRYFGTGAEADFGSAIVCVHGGYFLELLVRIQFIVDKVAAGEKQELFAVSGQFHRYEGNLLRVIDGHFRVGNGLVAIHFIIDLDGADAAEVGQPVCRDGLDHFQGGVGSAGARPGPD